MQVLVVLFLYQVLFLTFISNDWSSKIRYYFGLGLRIQNIISTEELCAMIEDGIVPIPDLYYTFKATDFSSVIDDLYFAIDLYSPNASDDLDLEIDGYNPNIDTWNDIVYVYSENRLRSVIQERFVPRLQNSCDLNDSFFRPQIDIDQLIRRSYLIFIISMSNLVLFTGLVYSCINPVMDAKICFITYNNNILKRRSLSTLDTSLSSFETLQNYMKE